MKPNDPAIEGSAFNEMQVQITFVVPGKLCVPFR